MVFAYHTETYASNLQAVIWVCPYPGHSRQTGGMDICALSRAVHITSDGRIQMLRDAAVPLSQPATQSLPGTRSPQAIIVIGVHASPVICAASLLPRFVIWNALPSISGASLQSHCP